MTVIERWMVLGREAVFNSVRDANDFAEHLSLDNPGQTFSVRKVEFAPVEQLQGAVERERVLRAAIAEALTMPGVITMRGALRGGLSVADKVKGQS